MNANEASRQNGFSAIELMIAMVLGLMVVGAIGSLFVQHKTNYRQNEQYAQMQENGRYALNLLASDVAAAGFWGSADCSNLANCRPSATISVQSDCGTNWAVPSTTQTTSHPTLQYLVAPSASEAPAGLSDLNCFVAADYVKAGTHVLSLQHVEGNPLYCRAAGDDLTGLVYLQTTGATGKLVKGADLPDCPVSATAAPYWRYLVHIYYVHTELSATSCAAKPNEGRCIPRLTRKTLTRQTSDGEKVPKIEDESGDLAEGIEYFHIEFGIDDNDRSNLTCGLSEIDGVPDIYPSPSELSDILAANPNELDCAISARIHVLVRSAEADSSYTDNKTYTFGTGDAAVTRAYNDHFRRKVFTTTVQLRNQQYH
ncbi:MAG: PilW family protein [Methylococcus sp.]|nr:PilW family protein [Methylococcus sp.]